MANAYFHFKQFTIWQDNCAMKVGTDGVLLGAWAENSGNSILDIGTGTGLIAVMLAQRYQQARITAIEIDKEAYQQAMLNIQQSPWKERIDVIHSDFNSFSTSEKYDLIVCNPPYFVNSLQSPDELRTLARHNQTLTYEGLIKGVTQHLFHSGKFCLILPTGTTEAVINLAKENGLYPVKLTHVITTPGKKSKRSLISFSFDSRNCETNELLIEVKRHVYSEDFIKLTKDFYSRLNRTPT